MKKLLFTISTGLVLASSSKVQAQWENPHAPNIIDSKIETIGAVTTYTYVTQVPVCFRINAEPVQRSGTNLIQIITQQLSGEYCPLCIDCYSIQTNTTILGTLEAGQYQLDLFYRPSEFTAPTTLAFLRQYLFTVEKKRQETPQLNSGSFQFLVQGEPGEEYIVQSSTDFVNWIPIRTNTGPFTFSIGITNTNAFYRTIIKLPE